MEVGEIVLLVCFRQKMRRMNAVQCTDKNDKRLRYQGPWLYIFLCNFVKWRNISLKFKYLRGEARCKQKIIRVPHILTPLWNLIQDDDGVPSWRLIYQVNYYVSLQPSSAPAGQPSINSDHLRSVQIWTGLALTCNLEILRVLLRGFLLESDWCGCFAMIDKPERCQLRWFFLPFKPGWWLLLVSPEQHHAIPR